MIRFAALVGMVLAASAWPLAWNAEYAAKERARETSDSFVEEISRVGKESLLSADDLMLLSFIKNLRDSHPEVEYATVWRNGQLLKFGQGRKETVYREVRTSVLDASRSIVLGLDMKALEKAPAGVPIAPDPWLMTGLGSCLMLVGLGAIYAERRSLPRPSSRKREEGDMQPREALVGVEPARQPIETIPA